MRNSRTRSEIRLLRFLVEEIHGSHHAWVKKPWNGEERTGSISWSRQKMDATLSVCSLSARYGVRGRQRGHWSFEPDEAFEAMDGCDLMGI